MKKRQLMCAPNEQVGFKDLTYPVMASLKMDGQRIICGNRDIHSKKYKRCGTAVHKKFHKFLTFAHEHQLVFDAELYSDTLTFSELMSELAPKKHTLHPDIYIQVFDMIPMAAWNAGKGSAPFEERYEAYMKVIQENNYFNKTVFPVTHSSFAGHFVLESFFQTALEQGYEGLITRSPTSPYKHGRATLNEEYMHKFKEWITIDAKIVGYEQSTKMLDDVKGGERTRDATGMLERSHKKETRELVEGIGSVKLISDDGIRFKATRAKDAEFPLEFINWENKDEFIGKYVEAKFQGHGTKDRPRFARITRFRPDKD